MMRAVFLDRDGVLIRDVGNLLSPKEIAIIDKVPAAIKKLAECGYLIVVVTNQAVVARGWATECEVEAIHTELTRMLNDFGATVDRFYYCPHHPNATLPRYRANCNCRKPRPGMILQAADEMCIDLNNSYMVGDRITDIIAGAQAGCHTILVECGSHQLPVIETASPIDLEITPDYQFANLLAAAEWIIQQ